MTAIAVMVLVSGILDCLGGVFLLIGIWTIPLGAYSIVLGVLEIIYATKILPVPMKVSQPAKYIAIMQIVNIVSCGVVPLVVGILSLIFYEEAEVQAYFAAQQGRAGG